MDIRKLLYLHRDEVRYQPYDEYISPSAEKIASEWEAMEKRVASVQRENKELYDMIADMVKDKNRLYERITELEAEML